MIFNIGAGNELNIFDMMIMESAEQADKIIEVYKDLLIQGCSIEDIEEQEDFDYTDINDDDRDRIQAEVAKFIDKNNIYWA